jgi:SPP1 gp7 family putative phage head morphogenesis protein
MQERAAGAPELNEVAARGRDDIFLGFITALGGMDASSILVNPDAILQTEARGRGLAIYDDVLRDPKVFSVMQTRRLAVIGKEWRILPASDARADLDGADQVRATLNAIPGFERDLEESMDALAKGFSMQEVLWALDTAGVRVAEIKHRDPRRFAFTIGGDLRLITAAQPIWGEPVPARKFLHTVFSPRYEIPYGESLLSRVYWWWWFKKHGVKFWVIFAEKFGMPTAVGKYPPGAAQTQKDTLLAALTAMQQEYAVTIPNTMTAELLEAQRTGTVNTYQELCNYCDEQIAMAILGQTLTSQVGPTGSFAAAKVHSDVRQDYVEADAKALGNMINTALVPWICDFNLPPSPAGYPKWIPMVRPEGDLLALAERDERLVNLGLKIPTRYFYESYRIPEPGPDEETLTPPANVAPATPSSSAPAQQFAEAGATAQALALSDQAEAIFASTLDGALTAYGNLSRVLRRELTASSSYQAAIRRLPDALAPADRSALGDQLHAAFVSANLAGRARVLEQAASTGAALATMAAGDPQFELTEAVDPLEAIRWFRTLRPMSPDLFSALSDALKLTAFRIANVEGDALITAVKDALGRALTEGTTFADFLRDINSVFDAAGVSRLNPYHAETVFRTNTKTAYEAGRLEQFQDPDVAGFFPFFQYHAVRDLRTRPNHAAMDGRIYRADDPIWQVWYPPAGFNCRCTVTAISTVEIRQRGIVESSPVPPQLRPDPGFGGTPMAALRLRRAA